jgi:transcriptional regulator with XRE-family HTH domain
VELSLNTYSDCIESFRAADQAMGSAFRQKLAALNSARECFIAETGKSRGFQSQFARDLGVTRSYISGIEKIAQSPEYLESPQTFANIGFTTAKKLVDLDSDTKTAAIEKLEQTGELTERDISDIESAPVGDSTRYIYIITNPSTPEWVKIGESFDPAGRASELNTASPFDYSVYFSAPLPAGLTDKNLHPIIRARGIAHSREWFRVSAAEAVDLVNSILCITTDTGEHCEPIS